MKNLFKKAILFIKDLSTYLHRGWQARLLGAYTKSFFRSLIFYLNQCRMYLYSDDMELYHIRDEKIKRLQQTAFGLHSLFPQDVHFSYSILLPVDKPQISFFQESVESVLNQSAPQIEILMGLMHCPSKQLVEVIENAKRNDRVKVRVFDFYSQEKISVINQLAQQASGNFLLIMGEEDWIRPDFLLRCEQTLRIFDNPENKVLYCHSNALSDRSYFIPHQACLQPKALSFPFFFRSFHEKGMLIPTSLWKQVGGLHLEYQGAEYEDLLLQLDLVGASFQHLPFFLYSSRFSTQPTPYKSKKVFLQSLERYSQAKQLGWQWLSGYHEESVRAVPPLPLHHSIQVVIPYKDQKILTMKCVKSLLKQKDVHLKITAVDNRSADLSIAKEIQLLGGEVISVDEPFNYSRLNNLAVKMTRTAQDCEIILFLNNDVELEPDAISEMLRWIHQSSIGMVGCRLHYPDERLQHGGVEINPFSREEMRWEHIEKFRSFDEMTITKTLGVFDAVTAACAMMKRQVFLEIGGFDEIWYPIGYSDTNLATKVIAKGLKCFYTPYAVGVHHESISRQSSIEDYEKSWWLHHLLLEQRKSSGLR